MDADKRTVYEFGDFVLETGQRRLLRRGGGEPIALTAKAFDTLLYFIEFERYEQVLPVHYRQHRLEDLMAMPCQDQQMLAAGTILP